MSIYLKWALAGVYATHLCGQLVNRVVFGTVVLSLNYYVLVRTNLDMCFHADNPFDHIRHLPTYPPEQNNSAREPLYQTLMSFTRDHTPQLQHRAACVLPEPPYRWMSEHVLKYIFNCYCSSELVHSAPPIIWMESSPSSLNPLPSTRTSTRRKRRTAEEAEKVGSVYQRHF